MQFLFGGHSTPAGNKGFGGIGAGHETSAAVRYQLRFRLDVNNLALVQHGVWHYWSRTLKHRL